MQSNQCIRDMDTLELRPATNADVHAVRDLVYGVLREYGLAIDPEHADAGMDDLEGNFHQRGGCFDVLVTPDGQVVGSVALYPVDDSTVELRKMFLLPKVRGRGLGKRLLEHALSEARKRGFRRITLETASVLTQAVALYRKYGFTPYQAAHCSCRCDQTYELYLE